MGLLTPACAPESFIYKQVSQALPRPTESQSLGTGPEIFNVNVPPRNSNHSHLETSVHDTFFSWDVFRIMEGIEKKTVGTVDLQSVSMRGAPIFYKKKACSNARTGKYL